MAAILITGDNYAAVSQIRGVAEGLGHFLLHAPTTENVIEDVMLNQVVLVIASENSRPFSEWEVCDMLREDPTLPFGLAILLLHSGDVDRRRFAASKFDGKIDADMPAQILTEEIVRHLGVNAGPETSDSPARPGTDRSRAGPIKTPSP